jgi:hypothetical protein
VPPSQDPLVRPVVVLCPPLAQDTPSPAWHDALDLRLAELGIAPIRPATGRSTTTEPAPGVLTEPERDRMVLAAWVADQAVAITAAGVDRPLILVATGPATSGLPALGFSQRASRRSVVAYVLVDGPLPRTGPATGDWPDAPVICVQNASPPQLDDDVTRGARLRGWRVLREEPVQAICALVQRWPDLA